EEAGGVHVGERANEREQRQIVELRQDRAGPLPVQETEQRDLLRHWQLAQQVRDIRRVRVREQLPEPLIAAMLEVILDGVEQATVLFHQARRDLLSGGLSSGGTARASSERSRLRSRQRWIHNGTVSTVPAASETSTTAASGTGVIRQTSSVTVTGPVF